MMVLAEPAGGGTWTIEWLKKAQVCTEEEELLS